MSTGYDHIRRMNDDEMTEYFRKFAEHYYLKGRTTGSYVTVLRPLDENICDVMDKKDIDRMLTDIGYHSNSI